MLIEVWDYLLLLLLRTHTMVHVLGEGASKNIQQQTELRGTEKWRGWRERKKGTKRAKVSPTDSDIKQLVGTTSPRYLVSGVSLPKPSVLLVLKEH